MLYYRHRVGGINVTVLSGVAWGAVSITTCGCATSSFSDDTKVSLCVGLVPVQSLG